ncbi:MAG: hypothetical protein WCK82_03275 [Bacteroidota bacterium]
MKIRYFIKGPDAPSVAYAQSPMLSQDGCSYLFYRTPVYLVAILHDLRHEVFFTWSYAMMVLSPKHPFGNVLVKDPHTFFSICICF